MSVSFNKLLINLLHRSNICPISVGIIPFPLVNPHHVTYKPFQNNFGRPIESLHDSFSFIGDSIKIYCRMRGK